MYKTTCRALILVFLTHCLTPSIGWGQTAGRTSSRSLNDQVNQRVQQAVDQQSPAGQFTLADQEVRRLHNERFAQQDSLLRAQRQQADEERIHNPQHIEEPDATRVARLPQPLLGSFSNQKARTLLELVGRNAIDFAGLIEYADPLDPTLPENDLLSIAYAAEMIGNSVDEAAHLDPTLYDLAETQALLPQVEARLLYRLALLGVPAPSSKLNRTQDPVSMSRLELTGQFHDSVLKTMAIGSLRLALLKVHRFYQAKNLPDPVDEYQKDVLAKSIQKSVNKDLPPVRVSEGGRTPSVRLRAPGYAKQQAAQIVEESGNIADFQKKFLAELRQLKGQKPEEGSADYQHLQVLAEYATTYAIEYNPEGLKDIVALFDEGVQYTYRGNVKNGDFKRDFSPILNAIFINIFENTRYSPMGDEKTKKIVSLLADFSDPKKYSLPTRIFSLEAASLLYRPFNFDPYKPANPNSVFAVFALPNLNKPNEELRPTFAWRVSEIYCPLSNHSNEGMQDYGLDASQMQELADKLAYIYDGFYDIHTPFFENADSPTRERDKLPMKCRIAMTNEPNKIKKDREMNAAIFDFTLQAAFWVYGGELFSLVGTAFRLTRGAVAALPKAGKAFSLAAKGEKIAAFNAEVRNGAKFANWVAKNRNQQGYFVEFIIEKEPQAVAGKPLARTTEVGSVRGAVTPEIEMRPITSTHQLQGQYSRWNPKRWVGDTPRGKIVGMQVTRMQPNFNLQVARAQFDTPITGLHSMQDIEKAWSQLRLVNDPATAMVYETKPYWSAMLDLRQAQMEQSLLSGLRSSMQRQMDLWVPMGEAAQKQGVVSASTKWWNMRWGRPQFVDGLVHPNTPFYVAPRTSLNLTRNTAGRMMTPEGIANIPELLPGFSATGTDLVTGNVYRQMFNAYFKPMNWTNSVSKTLLPDYIPTANFWKSVQKNPILGAQLLPQMVWRNRFVGTSLFFGAWAGLDHGVYPVYKGWLENRANFDSQQEINKYGNTFSEQQAKMDELLMQEMGMDTSDKRTMDTYQTVLQAQEDQADGTLMTAPIVLARRAMGMSFLDDATRESYAYQARKADLSRARLKQMHTTLEQNKQAQAEARLEGERIFKESIIEAQNQLFDMYSQGFAAVPGAKAQMQALFAQYTQDCLAAQTEEEREQIDERFIQQRDEILTPVDVWESVLAEYDGIIKTVKWSYAQDTDLITPAIEGQIRAIYNTYANEYIQVLRIKDPAQQQERALQMDTNLKQSLGQIWTQLQNEWIARHPQETESEEPAQTQEEEPVGYGPSFDLNAAE